LFGTQIINRSFLFANSNISVKYYSEDFPSVNPTRELIPDRNPAGFRPEIKLKKNIALNVLLTHISYFLNKIFLKRI
jgi:hypothetical protein